MVKSFVSLNIAIIGNGKKCEQFAEGLALAGHTIYFGNNEPVSISLYLLHEFDSIGICDVETAAAASDVIIIATNPDNVREVAYWLNDVRRKTIIDFTSFFSNSNNINTISAIRAITGAQHIVKCFDTRDYKKLVQPFLNSNNADVLMAGDSKKAKALLQLLATDMDLKQVYDFTATEHLPVLEDIYQCWAKHAQAQKPLTKIARAKVVKK